MRRVALTTEDNPYDVFDDFTRWYLWDTSQGYHTSSLVARLTRSSDELSESDNQESIEQAIDTILEWGMIPNGRKVVRNES